MKSKKWFLGLLILLPTVVFATPSIIITEIGACNSGDSEWVEVMNISDETVDLTAWKFYEQETNHGINTFDVGNGLQPFLDPEEVAIIVDQWEDFSVVFPDYTGIVFDSSWGSLNNSGESIALRDEQGEIDPSEQFTYPACEQDKSLERVRFDTDPTQLESWTRASVPTPGTVEEGFKPSTTEADAPIVVEEDSYPPAVNVEEDPHLPAEPPQDPPQDEETLAVDEEGYKPIPTEVNVRITEIQPHAMGEEPEWFEFIIETERSIIDISQWRIDKGDGNEKIFQDHADTIFVGEGFKPSLSEIAIDQSIRLYFTPSPVSLSDSGGTIRVIHDTGEVLEEVTFPDLKSGTRSDVKWSEVWTRDEITDQWGSIVIYEDQRIYYTHSRGDLNESLSTSSEQVQILISEVSPKREDDQGGDFIELYLVSTPSDGANLKYMKVKHNGTTLLFLEEDFWVEEGDFILIKDPLVGNGLQPFLGTPDHYHLVTSQDEKGLSSGSGTVEVILYANTSYEERIDALCWKDETLSQTETTRVETLREAEQWDGSCYEIRDIIKNESMARNTNYSDTDEQGDFFRHFNGSPGMGNEPQNQPPQAVITVQGTGRTAGTSPFSFNLTGEDSTDQDGEHDIKTYTWTMDGTSFSDRENPLSQRITLVGPHEIKLLIEDYSGATSEAVLNIQVYSPSNVGGEIVIVDKPVKLWVRDLLSTGKKKDLSQYIPTKGGIQEVSEDFFDDFLAGLDAQVLENMIASSRERRSAFPTFFTATTSVGEGFKPSLTNKQEAQTLVALYEEGGNCRKKACLFPTGRKGKLPPKIRKKAIKNLAYIFPEWREEIGESINE